MTLTVILNGKTMEMTFDETLIAAAIQQIPKRNVPLCGYVALRQALAEVGIRKGLSTLKSWVAKRKIPHRHFRGRVTFHLEEVLERIGGRG